MKTISHADIIQHKYTIFNCFPRVLAFTAAKSDSASQDGKKPQSHNNKYEYLQLPDWLNSFGIQPEQFARIQQVHSSKVISISKPGFYGDADGVITNKENVYLCVVTADCLPIFLLDTYNEAIGLIHAGWRGLQKKIIMNAVEEMKKNFGTNPHNLYIAVGPFIQQCCYEVGKEVAEKFQDGSVKHKNADALFLNLGEAAKQQLNDAGVPEGNYSISSTCTFCSNERLPSYRRNDKKAGRNVSVFGLTE